MSDLWMPDAVRIPQPGGVTLDHTLPPRVTWHITSDALDATGAQPPFGNVATYLKRVGYCPHIMLDPFTGYMEQYYPANVGARALTRWNEDGATHIQVEIYFSKGVVRDGKRYESVAETPCMGISEIAEWAEGFGIPSVWPMGAPSWTSAQDANIWNRNAGHYGHTQVPGETHSDPGPMPAIVRKVIERPSVLPLLLTDVEELYA